MELCMPGTGYTIPVDENLFSSSLAELNFRAHKKDTKTTYHSSVWSEQLDDDETEWWVTVENSDSKWTIHLCENKMRADSYRFPFETSHISWADKDQLECELRDWLIQNGKTLNDPPTIWWALSIGDAKNSYYTFALYNGLAGI